MPRPRKLRNPRNIVAQVEAEIKEEWDKLRGRLSWGEFFTTWYLRQKEVINAVVKIEVLERENKEKDKRIKELEKLVEKLMAENEKLQLKLEAYEKGKAAVSSRSTKIINALVKVLDEGKTFADTMSEIGIEHPQEQLSILKDLFITHDEYGNVSKVLRPVRAVKQLRGWVLVEGKEPGLTNYIFAREDTLKAARAVRVNPKPKVITAPRVMNPEQVKQELIQNLNTRVVIYERKLASGMTAEAQEYLLKTQKKLTEWMEKYSVELVEEIVFSDARFIDLFANSLASLKKKVKKKLEVET